MDKDLRRGIIRKPVDLASNKGANLLAGDRGEFRLQRGRVSPDLSLHIKIAGDDDKQQGNSKKTKAPCQESTPDTAATK